MKTKITTRNLFILGMFISILCAIGGAISIDVIGPTVTGILIMFMSVCFTVGCLVGALSSS